MPLTLQILHYTLTCTGIRYPIIWCLSNVHNAFDALLISVNPATVFGCPRGRAACATHLLSHIQNLLYLAFHYQHGECVDNIHTLKLHNL